MRPYLIIAALCGFSAVLLGAMGSHFLSGYMSEKGPELFKTANLYHLIHSLALFGVALLVPWAIKSKHAFRLLKISMIFFFLGILLFSGILYWVALNPGGALHYLIPVGGLCFMIGWLLLACAGFALKSETP